MCFTFAGAWLRPIDKQKQRVLSMSKDHSFECKSDKGLHSFPLTLMIEFMKKNNLFLK